MIVHQLCLISRGGYHDSGRHRFRSKFQSFPFYPPAVGQGDYSFPTVLQFTHTGERTMPINSTQGVGSEA